MECSLKLIAELLLDPSKSIKVCLLASEPSASARCCRGGYKKFKKVFLHDLQHSKSDSELSTNFATTADFAEETHIPTIQCCPALPDPAGRGRCRTPFPIFIVLLFCFTFTKSFHLRVMLWCLEFYWQNSPGWVFVHPCEKTHKTDFVFGLLRMNNAYTEYCNIYFFI